MAHWCQGTSCLVAAKAPLFPAYKTAAVGFSLCARRRRRVGARRSYFVPTVGFPSLQRPNPCLPPPRSRSAPPLLAAPAESSPEASSSRYHTAVPQSTHASSPYPTIEPPNRTLVVHRTLPHPPPARIWRSPAGIVAGPPLAAPRTTLQKTDSFRGPPCKRLTPIVK
jgi:hypothetical protein